MSGGPTLLPSKHLTAGAIAYRWAIAGSRLTRNAIRSRTVTPSTVAVATALRVAVLIRSPVTVPNVEAAPTTIVIAISVTVNVPETIRAQPSRNSQIAIIRSSQKRKDGRAAHLLRWERRHPSTIATHRGAVWTTCRTTPCDTAPTTSNATMIVGQHADSRGCGSRGLRPRPHLLSDHGTSAVNELRAPSSLAHRRPSASPCWTASLPSRTTPSSPAREA